MTAYDYDRQTWVTGEPARLLLIAQDEETLACLSGPDAARYLAFTRRRGEPIIPVDAAHAVVVERLATLKRDYRKEVR